ncbi:MAG: glycosyltransferase family 39 protein [Anaerolineae bacterium]|nr:glycosyltransferase family 39 protein [Anaerolineae bacterium]MDW8173869.1 glycosyltransferase family 39 protein [Anaerolineae bacterium]
MAQAVLYAERRSGKLALSLALLVAWLIVLAHQSAGETLLLGRYSARYALAAVVVSAMSLLGLALLWTQAARLDGLMPLILKRALVPLILGLGLVWALPIEAPLKLYPSIMVWAALARWGSVATPPSSSLLAGLLLILMIAYGLGLVYMPPIELHDEGAYAFMAHTHQLTGRLGGDLYDWPVKNYIGFGSWLIVLDVWQRVFGWGWWEGRSLAYAWSLLALIGIGGAARAWLGPGLGLPAALLLASSGIFLDSLRIRPDMPMLALGSLALWAFAEAWRRGGWWRFSLTGCLAMLALEAHLLALVFWGACGLMIGLRWLWTGWRARRLAWPWAVLAYVVGSLPPLASYVVVHFVPDWQAGGLFIAGDPNPFSLIRALEQEALRWADYAKTYPANALVAVVALLLAWRADGEQRLLAALLLVSAAAYLVVAPSAQDDYTRYFLPLIVLLSAGLFSSAQPRPQAWSIAWLVVALSVGAVLPRAYNGAAQGLERGIFQRPVPPAVPVLLERVPPGETIIAPTHLLMHIDPDRYRFYNAVPNPYTLARMRPLDPERYYDDLNPAIFLLDPTSPVQPWLQTYLDAAGFVRLPDQADVQIYLRPDLYDGGHAS